MQAARHPFRQHVVPNAPGAVGPIARKEAGANPRAKLFNRSGCAGCAVVSAKHNTPPREIPRLERNRTRDQTCPAELGEIGWDFLVVWEEGSIGRESGSGGKQKSK